MEDAIDIEALLARMAPPRVPDEVFDSRNASLSAVQSWKRNHVAPILAGLSTDPSLHANGIRLDWLQRLVLSKAAGRRKPGAAEVARALNDGLGRAGVLRLEDPSEDLFCELIATVHGNFRIFPGQWETAGAYTQTLLDAFESLPPASRKSDALASVYALLGLSEALAERGNVDPRTSSGGAPMSTIALPRSEALERLSRRVRFTDSDLVRLSIDKSALTPFFLEPDQYQYVTDREPGDTPLEFHPLLSSPNGLVVASPANISVAARSVLVNAAQIGGMADTLLHALMEQQERHSESSRFWPVPYLRLSPPNQHNMRGSVCQFGEGRFLHVIQVPATFDGFPRLGFASVRALAAEANAFIGEDTSRFWRFLRDQPDYRQGVTVLLMSGWGTPHSVSPSIDEGNVPPGWQFLGLSFADAAVLGACEHGKFRDICRLVEQVERLERQGFAIQNINGTINLFAHWRATHGNLIPEHMREMVPPCNIMIPTDGLLTPRIEAARNRDPRALSLPSGGYKRVQRMDWHEGEESPPIYASHEDAGAGRLLGAVVLADRTWWVECAPEALEAREWCYRVWHAALQWLATVGEKVIARYPHSFPAATFMVRLVVPENAGLRKSDRSKFTGQSLEETVSGLVGVGGQNPVVTISPAWIEHLWKPENDAELEMAAAILGQLAVPSLPLTRTELREEVRTAIKSNDWRWLHAHPVVTPLDHLRSSALVGSFQEPSFSAAASARCCSIWSFRNPSEGLEIEGELPCEDFLARYRDHVLGTLVSRIRMFDRARLAARAADAYQAARVEQQSWRGTIRAMRAIHGAAADERAFKRQNEINAIQRASKTVCEIAACEAASPGGLDPGATDLEELFGLALLLVGNGQLFASIRGGILKPSLRISPAGDLLSDRSIFDTTLRPGAEWVNARALDDAARSYGEERATDQAQPRGRPWEADLRKAIEAEYGVPAEAFASLQYEVVTLAKARGQSTFILRRTELSDTLSADPNYPGDNIMPLLRRLTLSRRSAWNDRSSGLSEGDIDPGRFDRRFSLINRPLLALDDDTDPHVLVAPLFVSDATMYSLSGLMAGSLQGNYWDTREAVSYAGGRADVAGQEFEESVAQRLRDLGLWARSRCELAWALNQKVDNALGNIDVLAISADRRRVWVIEAKNLKLCRTETEVAARLSEYRGRSVRGSKGREKPDKLLRHLRRVQYLRERNAALCGRLQLDAPPEVKGLLMVDSPQPMNFHMLENIPDAQSAYLDALDRFQF